MKKTIIGLGAAILLFGGLLLAGACSKEADEQMPGAVSKSLGSPTSGSGNRTLGPCDILPDIYDIIEPKKSRPGSTVYDLLRIKTNSLVGMPAGVEVKLIRLVPVGSSFSDSHILGAQAVSTDITYGLSPARSSPFTFEIWYDGCLHQSVNY